MAKWEVKKAAETLLTKKCSDCDHTEGHHNHSSKGKMNISYCNLCDCKEFKVKTKDKLKGLFSSKK